MFARRTLFASLERHYGRRQTLEMIGFQSNDKFGPELEALVSKVKDLIDQKTPVKILKKDVVITEIQDLIFKRLGLKTELHIDSHLAATMPNVYVPHSAVHYEYARDWMMGTSNTVAPGASALKKSGEGIKGYVDLKNARVSGWFSTQVAPLYLNFKKLFIELESTAAEVTAMCLHELGHIFDAIEYLNRVQSTNQVLADVAKYIQVKDRAKDVQYVYRELKKIDPEVGEDIAQALCSDQALVMGPALQRLSVGVVHTLMKDKTYDRTSFEQTSDQFASRFGYGEALITGLVKFDKVHSSEDFEAFRTKGLNFLLFFGLIDVALFIMGLATGAALGVVMGGFYGFLCFWILTKVTGESGKVRLYDDNKNRYLRIRNQMVEQIKDQELSQATQRQLLGQIMIADDIVKSCKQYSNVYDRVANVIFSKDRRAKESILEQQRLEEMVANDLFVKSAHLSLAT